MKRLKEILSDGLILGGAGVLVYAGFMFLPVVGWALLGLVLIALGWVIGLEEKK